MIALPRLSLLSFHLFFILCIFIVSIRADAAESLELLRRAQANDVDSQVNLAILKSLSGEVKEAHYWYRRAAKQNHPLASRIVGLNHFQGNGTSKNPNMLKRRRRNYKRRLKQNLRNIGSYMKMIYNK